MTQIEHWLNSDRNYDSGTLLYNLYGNNHNLKRVFMRGPDEYNIEKLASELGEIKHLGNQVVPVIVTAPLPDQPATPVIPTYDRQVLLVSEKPAKYDELHKLWKDAYKNASYLQQHKLGKDQSKEVRAEAAKEIMDLFGKVITPAWDQLAHFDEYGTFPEEIVEVKVYETEVDILKRRNNLRTYITKFKDDPKKASSIEGWKKEMDDLNIKLNGITGQQGS
jgi:hypothetical protein